jgi:hypothetical protein
MPGRLDRVTGRVATLGLKFAMLSGILSIFTALKIDKMTDN